MFGKDTKYNQMMDAEKEYLESVKDVADTQAQQAEEMDFTKEAEQAEQEAQELTQRENEVRAVKADTQGMGRMAAAITKASTQRADENFQDTLNRKAEMRNQKNQTVLQAKQYATEQAKMKYELASQAWEQAVTRWMNAAKTLLTFGVSAPGQELLKAVKDTIKEKMKNKGENE